MTSLIISQPDDWHLHLRDGNLLNRTVADAARSFRRAIIMPNLRPPVTDIALAEEYRQRILNAVQDSPFEPLMTLYLTDNTTAELVREARLHSHIYAFKLYPAGATTHSDAGVTDIKNIYPALEAMAELDIPLLIHGEVTDPKIDIFDREQYFIEQILNPLLQAIPNLRVVLEHITTKDAVAYVHSMGDNLAATITAHHLLLNRNDLLSGAIRPHYYCLPILKRNTHQQALITAATSGNKKFFIGTDSAPHSQMSKESSCGCAGIYTAHAALELYAEVFEQANAMDKLEAFTSFYGADFYGLPRNTEKITLVKQDWRVPESLSFGDDRLIPFCAGKTLSWNLE